MPERVTGKPACEWRCRGRVVRVQPPGDRDKNLGVAVVFQYYEVVAGEGARFQN